MGKAVVAATPRAEWPPLLATCCPSPAAFQPCLALTRRRLGGRSCAGLQELAVRFDEEEEVPPLNLQGDVSALSSLRQVGPALHVDPRR